MELAAPRELELGEPGARAALGFEYVGKYDASGLEEGHGIEREKTTTYAAFNVQLREVYEGEFRAGQREGHGTMACTHWESGMERYGCDIDVLVQTYIYVGQWVDGYMEGRGTTTDAVLGDPGAFPLFDTHPDELPGNGAVHVGEYKRSEYEGRGTETYDDGRVFEGEFKDGTQEGRGTMRSPDGGVYDGEWAAGLACGRGTYTAASGVVYEGCFRDPASPCGCARMPPVR